MFIHGHRLSNCIIDSRASSNIMPTILAKTLDLLLTKMFDKFYAMDSKKVPLVDQIKGIHVSLIEFPDKKLKLTILIIDS